MSNLPPRPVDFQLYEGKVYELELPIDKNYFLNIIQSFFNFQFYIYSLKPSLQFCLFQLQIDEKTLSIKIFAPYFK